MTLKSRKGETIQFMILTYLFFRKNKHKNRSLQEALYTTDSNASEFK